MVKDATLRYIYFEGQLWYTRAASVYDETYEGRSRGAVFIPLRIIIKSCYHKYFSLESINTRKCCQFAGML